MYRSLRGAMIEAHVTVAEYGSEESSHAQSHHPEEIKYTEGVHFASSIHLQLSSQRPLPVPGRESAIVSDASP